MNITTIKERPILFSGPMVRAILEGRKTQTRRVVTPQPPSIEAVVAKSGSGFSVFTDHHSRPGEFRVAGPVWAVRELMEREPIWRCPYGSPGDQLWVRESFCHKVDDRGRIVYNESGNTDAKCFLYAADGEPTVLVDGDGFTVFRKDGTEASPWVSGIRMPREASRITLEVADVRVERLLAITEDDAISEGVTPADNPDYDPDDPCDDEPQTHRAGFLELWDSINGSRGFPYHANPWVWVVCFKRLETTP